MLYTKKHIYLIYNTPFQSTYRARKRDSCEQDRLIINIILILANFSLGDINL